MYPSYNFEYKTVSTTTWKRKNVINQEKLDGWNYVREERVTARKVAIVFWKKFPIPMISKLETEARKYLADNLTEEY